MTNEAKALVVVSSVTGNTRVVGHWLADAYARGRSLYAGDGPL